MNVTADVVTRLRCEATFDAVRANRRPYTHTCDLDAAHDGPHHCPVCLDYWTGATDAAE